MTSRLFIGLEIPIENIDKLIEDRDKIYGDPSNLNWEDEEKLHITVKFLGDVGENILDLMIRRFEEIEANAINTKFDKFSFFKNNGKLRILYASLVDNPKIVEFQKNIEEECALLGFSEEKRRFHPHITLLRIKGGEDFSRLAKFIDAKIDDAEFVINSFSIFKSELKSTGSEYTKLKSFKLR